MAIEKFRFVSPGVQVNEIDDSIITPAPPVVGPVVIGNTAKGPAMQPVQVSSVAELERVFGAPSNGNVGATDVWRTGIPTSPTLATYAAKAFLTNTSPITVVRLAGAPVAEVTDTEAGWSADAGYVLGGLSGSTVYPFAKIYVKDSTTIELSGTTVVTSSSVGWSYDKVTTNDANLQLRVNGKEVKFSKNKNEKHFIRNVLNTNPSRYSDTANYGYFLGETFEDSLTASFNYYILYKPTADVNYTSAEGATSARSGMVISELVSGSTAQYTDLFYFEGLNNGSALSKDIKLSIENVRPSKNATITKYGTFDIVIRKLFEGSTDAVLERFTGVTLDPESDNYIVRRIGDSYRKWNAADKRYQEFGTYSNKSSYVRVVLADADIPATALPAGFRMPSVQTISFDGKTGTYPQIHLVDSVRKSSAKNKRFGLAVTSGSSTGIVTFEDTVDILGYKPSMDFDNGSIFSVDYVSGSTNNYVYTNTYQGLNLLTSGSIAGFDMPMYGGFDAKDITTQEPFVNNALLASGDEKTNPKYRAIKQAVDMVADPDVIDMNTLVVPGLQNTELTDYMLDVCRTRGDAQAIIDLEGDYLYPYEVSGDNVSRPTSVTNVVGGAKERSFDNSYGAAYFPAVFVPSAGIFMPASIAALGAIGGTEGRSALWFAPAGFNRGGLTELTAGISVSKTALHLVSSDRDALYDNNINPIATFPNEGVVIFGQKTLQATPSALDRVNVRRLVNYIKKQISRAATRVLFEPNVEATWSSFKSLVDPFLLAIKNNYGLDDAKVVLDSSTTTADLVDRNIMYCKIYLRPTRAIEYIAIDFVVTNNGSLFSEG